MGNDGNVMGEEGGLLWPKGTNELRSRELRRPSTRSRSLTVTLRFHYPNDATISTARGMMYCEV